MAALTELAPPRLALGCLRLAEPGVDARAVVQAAWRHGIRAFDVAHAYGDGTPGETERLLSSALAAVGWLEEACLVTKVGLRRLGRTYRPDGRAASLLADAEASAQALGRPADVLLLHAVDGRVPWATQVRALGQALDRGFTRAVGLSNVRLPHLEEAGRLIPLACVQVEWSPFNDTAVRGGLVERCLALGVPVMAHTPFGGPRRAAALARLAPFTSTGGAPQAAVLAALAACSPLVIPVPGARRVDSVDSWFPLPAASEPARAALWPRVTPRAHPPSGPELVLVMGLPGAGKSRLAQALVARGAVRLNRDERGGTLKSLARDLEVLLAQGAGEVVADNTFLDRASRHRLLEVAARHGRPVRGLWLDIPVAQARINVIQRQLEREGRLLPVEVLEARRGDLGVTPGALDRLVRALERPTLEEGFAALEVVPFARERKGLPDAVLDVVALEALPQVPARPGVQRLALAWLPEATPERVEACRRLADSHGATLAFCPHPAGPPQCWCRPPLPGLVLAACHALGAAPGPGVHLHGTSPAHRTMANALGASFTHLPGHG